MGPGKVLDVDEWESNANSGVKLFADLCHRVLVAAVAGVVLGFVYKRLGSGVIVQHQLTEYEAGKSIQGPDGAYEFALKTT
jgi:hypothetical protein